MTNHNEKSPGYQRSSEWGQPWSNMNAHASYRCRQLTITLTMAFLLAFTACFGCERTPVTMKSPPPTRDTASLNSTVPAAARPNSTMNTVFWEREGLEIVGLVGATVYHWDRKMDDGRGGIVGLSVTDGRELSRKPIAELNINGVPQYWLPAPDGFLAAWDNPMHIEHGTAGPYRIRWQATSARWNPAVLANDALVVWQYRPSQSVIALSVSDGSEIWRAPLIQEANGVELRFDGDTVYAVWQQYSATSPTPKVTIPQRVRALDAATGRARWTRDFSEHTGGIATTRGVLVVAKGADLVFMRGDTGTVVRTVPTGHRPNVYPRFATADTVVYVGLWDAVTAYRVDTGTALWRHPIQLDGGPAMTVVGRSLLVSTEHGSVVALDRDTGHRQWELGTGFNPHRILASDAGVVVNAGSAVGFSLPARFQTERALISGRVDTRCQPVSEVVVAVGDKRVRPDKNGAYTAEVNMAGTVLISGPGSGMPERIEPYQPNHARIRLTGKRRYTAPPITLNYCDRG